MIDSGQRPPAGCGRLPVYENDYPGRGDRFVAAVDVVLRNIAEHPERFPLLQEPDVRSAKVKRSRIGSFTSLLEKTSTSSPSRMRSGAQRAGAAG